MLNRTILVGRLTRDPELRTTQSGVNVASFTLAVNRTFTNAQGEREADFINCVVFRRQADNVNNYLSKGSLAGVDGRLQS
ncbi:single-stranded DNA-binding protein, partial [Staphylococcus aureus]